MTISIDDQGVSLPADFAESEHVVDVLFDDRRIWSFRPAKAAEVDGEVAFTPWPKDLRGFLNGASVVTLRTTTGEPIGAQEVSFGEGEGRVTVADKHGMLLVVDPADRLISSFETREMAELQPLVDAVEIVLKALNAAGVSAFPAYGTLLGAVREGKLIGHDNDADVGYVSSHTHPADVIIESFRLQRVLQQQGFEITRYSGAAFKVVVRDSERGGRGLDVFAGFLYEGQLVLMGEIFAPFEREWLLPLGTVQLEGVTLPAPAQPERLLAAMYGEQWRVPDPTFKFETGPEVSLRLDQWFRGTRTYRNVWDRRYSTSRERGPIRKPHQLTKQLHRGEAAGTTVVDVGCGRGGDAVWLARRDHPVIGFDFAHNGFAHLKGRALEEGWPVEFLDTNLLEVRHTMALGARLARIEGPKAILARHILNATTTRGRRNFWRLAQMTLGHTGGRLYLEFTSPDPGSRRSAEFNHDLIWNLDADKIEAEGVAAGARVVSRQFLEPGHYECPARVIEGSPPLHSARMVLEWAKMRNS